MFKSRRFLLRSVGFLLIFCFLFSDSGAYAKAKKKQTYRSKASLSAQAAVVVDARTGRILFSKNPNLKLPPASTTKVMTAILAFEKLPLQKLVSVSQNAFNATPSKAGLTVGEKYRVYDLIVACLVSSSNDAAIALAEEMGDGSEKEFARMMNLKAISLGMSSTCFINATGLPENKRKQYTTAYDLTRLMSYALRDRRVDDILGVTYARIYGTDKKPILLRSHNKMLWKTPRFVKGKTGWTFASRHTFVGTNYEPDKKIMFAMLSSREPWDDIRRLATQGMSLLKRV